MSYNLFLDDVRIPADAAIYMNANIYELLEWKIVRTYDAFVKHITENGMPEIISFDHDLGEDIVREKISNGMSKRQARIQKRETKSGYDCAKWLVSHCIENNIEPSGYIVHSMNPAGTQNILSYLDNYRKSIKK